MGPAANETVWEPLLRGKFGVAAPEIGMPWFWARVHDRTQRLGYLRGGFQQLYERMAGAVRSAGGETRFGVVLALDRPLSSVYWLNINDPGYPFMVLAEHTNYMPAADYNGRHLVYLGNYRPMADSLMSASKETVLDEFLSHLERLNPAFDRSSVTESWMFAAPYAQPIVTVAYRDHIPPSTPRSGTCGRRASSRSTHMTGGRTIRSPWLSGSFGA